MSLQPRKEDYYRENIKKTSSKYMKKVKLPTQVKTKPKFCRNCLTLLPVGRTVCKQCGCDKKPLGSRR